MSSVRLSASFGALVAKKASCARHLTNALGKQVEAWRWRGAGSDTERLTNWA